MKKSPFLLFIPPYLNDEARRLELPISRDENIFARLLGRSARGNIPLERAAAEMFCVLLKNSKILRIKLINWICSLLKESFSTDLSLMEWLFETETMDDNGKRNDLRIEGKFNDLTKILWIIEIKVGAGFHSSSITDADIDTEIEKLKSLVNQLINYDRWLQRQRVKSRCGIVLAIDDLTEEVDSLSGNLKSPWICITWADLGHEIEKALTDNSLPEIDKLLAQHVAGYIRRCLWKEKEMSNDPIDFDDVSLMRGISALGGSCKKKLTNLVSPLKNIFESLGEGVGEVTKEFIFTPDIVRFTFCHQLAESLPNKSGKPAYPPAIFAGIDFQLNLIGVWIRTSPAYPAKADITESIKLCRQKLENQETWTITGDDRMKKGTTERWFDIYRTFPTEKLLLIETNQDEWLMNFVKESLDHLHKAGILEAITNAASKHKIPN